MSLPFIFTVLVPVAVVGFLAFVATRPDSFRTSRAALFRGRPHPHSALSRRSKGEARWWSLWPSKRGCPDHHPASHSTSLWLVPSQEGEDRSHVAPARKSP